jgi:HSP20 family protein
MAKKETEVPVEAEKVGEASKASKAGKTEAAAGTARTEVSEEGRRGPLSAVPRMQHEMERLFDDFMSKNWMRHWRDEWPSWPTGFGQALPRVDVIDRDNEVVVKAEVPGFAADEIDLSITDNTMSIKGSHREEKEEDGEYHRREISSSFVTRTVSLPTEVDGDKAKAKLRDGVLEVTVPKAKKTTRRSITVES